MFAIKELKVFRGADLDETIAEINYFLLENPNREFIGLKTFEDTGEFGDILRVFILIYKTNRHDLNKG